MSLYRPDTILDEVDWSSPDVQTNLLLIRRTLSSSESSFGRVHKDAVNPVHEFEIVYITKMDWHYFVTVVRPQIC
jgi:hypothetical protein